MKSSEFFKHDIIQPAEEFIKPGSVVPDISSNLGQMTVAFTRFDAPMGMAHAFEADALVI